MLLAFGSVLVLASGTNDPSIYSFAFVVPDLEYPPGAALRIFYVQVKDRCMDIRGAKTWQDYRRFKPDINGLYRIDFDVVAPEPPAAMNDAASSRSSGPASAAPPALPAPSDEWSPVGQPLDTVHEEVARQDPLEEAQMNAVMAATALETTTSQ